MKLVSSEEAVSHIQSNHHIYIHTAAAAPQQLIQALTDRHNELKSVQIFHLHTEGIAPYTKPEYRGSFKTHAFFTGKNVRPAMQTGEADYIPVFLSEVPHLFHRGIVDLGAALINVSPPDKHGYCSLGISIDATRAAILNAGTVIAQINPNMPRTHGDGLIHKSEIHYAVEVNDPLPEHKPGELSDVELKIGKNCAELIEDGATLQMGIGNIPDAVLSSLDDHKKLGIHTEMFSDGMIPLIESGVVTTRAHVHYVVTEYGVANLYGQSLRRRAKRLIEIAHPDHREELEEAAYDRFQMM